MLGWNLQSYCVPKGANASAQACQGGDFIPNLRALQDWAPVIDTDDWMDAAASFGAKYAVLVADHFSGFLLWPSTTSNVSLAATRSTVVDAVGAFAASCAARGIAPGYFYSVHDNWVLGVDEFRAGAVPRLYGGPPLSASEYEAIALAQLRELLTQYPIEELWFDAGTSPALTPHLGALVAQLSPDVVCHSCWGFDQRGAGNESGAGVGLRWMGDEEAVMPLPNWGTVAASYLPYGGGDPLGAIYAPASCDTVLSEHHWFNAPNMRYDNDIRSTCSLVNAYLTSVGRGCNLILNVAPDWLGTISPKAKSAYAALGTAISCLASVPLARVDNFTLYDAAGAAPLANGTSTWTLAEPVRGTPCAAGACFNVSLRLSEATSSSGQRIGAWAVAGCFAAACAADAAWVPLTAALPAAAATAIGARRFVHLTAAAPPAAALTALRFTVMSAYEWAGTGGAPHGKQPLVLASAALFDWTHAPSCVPAGCKLSAY